MAQSSMLATLSHNGEISTFYGATALRDAYNASEHGDIITLSSGSFTAVNIEKAVTIRGAGMQVNTKTQTYPTIITGDFYIQIPNNVEQRLTMEGLYSNSTINVRGTLQNATFLKNRFSVFGFGDGAQMDNLTFIHCKIAKEIYLPDESSVSCINCYVDAPKCWSGSKSNYEFTNCVIAGWENIGFVWSSSFINCIIYDNERSNNNDSKTYLNENNTAFYCLGKNFGNNMFCQISNSTNTNLTDEVESLFKTYARAYNDSETFELTDEAKAKYLGSDGTEVGMYGGNMPFDPTPSNPQITKCNVAAKSTADGKLSVDIEVSAAE